MLGDAMNWLTACGKDDKLERKIRRILSTQIEAKSGTGTKEIPNILRWC